MNFQHRCSFGKRFKLPHTHTHTHTLHRFVGKEFESVEVEKGVETTMLRLLKAHSQYSCVKKIAELQPQLKEGEEVG